MSRHRGPARRRHLRARAERLELWKFFPETNSLVELGAFNCAGWPTPSRWPSTASASRGSCSTPRRARSAQARRHQPRQLHRPRLRTRTSRASTTSAWRSCRTARSTSATGSSATLQRTAASARARQSADFFSVDPETQLIKKLGKTNFNSAEVTGTGDGRAFLFGRRARRSSSRSTRPTATPSARSPCRRPRAGGGLAFAFFAGDFYMFTDGQNNGSSARSPTSTTTTATTTASRTSPWSSTTPR